LKSSIYRGIDFYAMQQFQIKNMIRLRLLSITVGFSQRNINLTRKDFSP